MSFEKRNKKYKKTGLNLEASKMNSLVIDNNVNDILKNIKQHTNTDVIKNDSDYEYEESDVEDVDEEVSSKTNNSVEAVNNNVVINYNEKIKTGLTKEKSVIDKDKYLGNMNEKDNQDIKNIEDNILYINPLTEHELVMDPSKFDIKYYPKKLGYSEVERVIRSSFYTKQDYYSAAFDIIATYLKGQKLLYIESEQYCKKHYHMMIFPAIFLTALTAVLSLSIIENNYGPVFVSSLCAFNGFLISLANYSKFNVVAEAHKITAKQYEKLQTECEFTSGRMMVLPTKGDEDEMSSLRLERIERKIKEIKEINKNILPRYLRRMLPKVNNTNVFSLVKQITNYETLYINNIKDELNELRVLEYKEMRRDIEKEEKLEMRELRRSIKTHTRNLLELRNEYNQIDVMFRKEIQNLNRSNWVKCLCCNLFEKEEENAKLKHLFNSNI